MSKLYPRYCKQRIDAALTDTPVVFISGPRQCGKTTLVKEFQQEEWAYFTFDDLTQLELAKHDPVSFVRSLTATHTILDEIHRVPELFLALKQTVDEDRRPGRFLLTGSANALTLPTVSDSLAGRMEVLSLLPLAECEIQKIPSTFLNKVLAGIMPTARQTRIRPMLIEKILRGGFPEPMQRQNPVRQHAWYLQYIQRIIQKDVKDLGQIEHLTEMPKLVQLLSQQVGKLTNYSELAGRIGLSRVTTIKYTSLLEQLYLFETLPAWHRNENKRLIKTPKVHIVDTGLLCALRRINQAKIMSDLNLLGSLVENYIFCELKRLSTWQEEPLSFYHYRDKDKAEVDIVLETLSGAVIGIEVKASATLSISDFDGLKKLKQNAGSDFLMGILLYDGDHSTAFEENIYAVPLSSVWE